MWSRFVSAPLEKYKMCAYTIQFLIPVEVCKVIYPKSHFSFEYNVTRNSSIVTTQKNKYLFQISFPGFFQLHVTIMWVKLVESSNNLIFCISSSKTYNFQYFFHWFTKLPLGLGMCSRMSNLGVGINIII